MDAGERGIAPLPFQKRGTWVDVPLHNSFISNFMVYQKQFETNLLYLFAHQ